METPAARGQQAHAVVIRPEALRWRPALQHDAAEGQGQRRQRPLFSEEGKADDTVVATALKSHLGRGAKDLGSQTGGAANG